jgi:hypothetical protein
LQYIKLLVLSLRINRSWPLFEQWGRQTNCDGKSHVRVVELPKTYAPAATAPSLISTSSLSHSQTWLPPPHHEKKGRAALTLRKPFWSTSSTAPSWGSSYDQTSQVRLVGMQETYAPAATVPLLTSTTDELGLCYLDTKKVSASNNSFCINN